MPLCLMVIKLTPQYSHQVRAFAKFNFKKMLHNRIFTFPITFPLKKGTYQILFQEDFTKSHLYFSYHFPIYSLIFRNLE